MNLNFKCTEIFEHNFNSNRKIVVNRGGTRSSKTTSLCQIAVLWLFTGKVSKDLEIKSGIFTIARKFSASLDKSILRDFENILNEHNLFSHLKINKATKTYKYKNRVVEFIGVDDEQKIRGATRDILYCNEANELSFQKEFFQLLIRTKYKIFIDFNPDDEDIWINTEIEQKRMVEQKDVELIVSSYQNNPFLSNEIIKEIENLKTIDPMFWEIYGKGEYGQIQGLVFKNWDICEKIPDDAKFISYGLDFGFSNDPTALIEIFKYDNELYLNELIYEKGLLNSEIIDKFKYFQLNQNSEIFADSAEPKSIEEIKRSGYNIKGVKKFKDSIEFGIDIMKQYKLNITEKSLNLRKELRHYKWKEDKNGKATNDPIDDFNHAIDAARYAIMSKIAKAPIFNKVKQVKNNDKHNIYTANYMEKVF